MKKSVLLAAILAGAILNQSFAASAPTAAKPQKATTIDNIRDVGAFASFESVDETGCIVTDVGVQVTLYAEHVTGSPTTRASSVDVYVNVWDSCNYLTLFSAQGNTTQFTFLIDRNNLDGAALATRISTIDGVTNDGVDLDIKLKWQATAPLQKSYDREVTSTNGVKTILKIIGNTREAVASGTFVSGGVNYTPDPSFLAELHNAKGGTITITKP